MDVEIILIALSILLIAWALERIFGKIQSVERHISGLRKRVKAIEQRVAKVSSQSQQAQRGTEKRRVIGAPAQTTQVKKSEKELPATTVCAFCGTEYDMSLNKCPKCHHINIEKYRLQRS